LGPFEVAHRNHSGDSGRTNPAALSDPHHHHYPVVSTSVIHNLHARNQLLAIVTRTRRKHTERGSGSRVTDTLEQNSHLKSHT
jgi:hypothetical protein